MTAKDWLQRGWKLDQEINALEEAKRKAYDRCVSATARPDSVPGGAESSPSDGGMSAYANFAALIDEQIDKLVDIKRETANVICRVENPRLRNILTRRYINFSKFEQMALDLDIDYRWLMRLHKKSLAAVQEILDEIGI